MAVCDSYAGRCLAYRSIRALTDERRSFTEHSNALLPESPDRLSGAELRTS